MSKFDLSKVYGSRVEYISSIDPSIDWKKSEINKKEYEKSPVANSEKLAFLPGVAPIKIYLHHPTEEELMVAFHAGDLDVSAESGAVYIGDKLAPGTGAVLGITRAQEALASLCIDSIENLDEFPADPKKKNGFGLLHLSDDAKNAIGPGPIQKAILKEIGRYLMEASTPAGESLTA